VNNGYSPVFGSDWLQTGAEIKQWQMIAILKTQKNPTGSCSAVKRLIEINKFNKLHIIISSSLSKQV
jgi:hypothetical protein